MDAVNELVDSDDPRAARRLITALRDENPLVAIAVVRALERLRDPVGVIPIYELMLDEGTDEGVRHAAAEALVTLGLLRRERVGPSRFFLWLVGMVLVIVAVAAAEYIGPAAIVLFAIGAAALIGFYVKAMRKERQAGTYIGPDGDAIEIPIDVSAGVGELFGTGDGSAGG